MSPIQSAAFKVAISAAACAIIAFRLHRSDKPRDQWGLVAPASLAASAGFVAVYLAWMFGSDIATGWRGPWDFAPWQQAPVAASAMRILAVCLFGPAFEELLFRGFFFGLLRDRIGIPATITLTAVGWAALHFDYAWWVVAIIVVDGLLLGLARWRTGSVFVPIAMHALYNLYAIW